MSPKPVQLPVRQQPSILGFARGGYLKLALGVCAFAVAVYAWHEPPLVQGRPHGGTWLGYTLGTVCAVLVLWLMLLGVRKRSYASRIGSVQGWTSAHVYLGASLLILASLHAGFEFGWNVHTLAYVLLVAVIASGVLGLLAYIRIPERMTANLAGATVEAIVLEIADLDRKCRALALDLPDEVNRVVGRASRAREREIEPARSLWRQRRGDRVPCPTRDACAELQRLCAGYVGQQADRGRQLLVAMTRKSALVDRLRRDMRYRALLQAWRYFHVPLSFALLGALIAHIVSVFYFW